MFPPRKPLMYARRNALRVITALRNVRLISVSQDNRRQPTKVHTAVTSSKMSFETIC